MRPNGKQIHESSSHLKAVGIRHTRKLFWMLAVIVVAASTLAFAVRAYNRRTLDLVSPTSPLPSASRELRTTFAAGQQSPQIRRNFQSRLAFQLEANKMRRRLGQRFVAPGREATIVDGALTLDGRRQAIRIIRTQADEAGEQVVISIGGGQPSLTWNAAEGAKSNNGAANAIERKVIERIALDSPDQFILAQVRGANYYTIARAVMPAEAADPESYSGPIWDLVRISEPQRETGNKPESVWRIFYINCSTGLIDRILYQEQGEEIMVAFSGWASRGGELAPAQTRWTRGGQVVMELSLNNISYGSR